MATAKEVKLTRGERLVGAKVLADELGVSYGHLRMVRLGERRSPRVEEALEAHGIKVLKRRRAAARA